MGLIITYDLSGKNKPVKDEMIDNKGYSKVFYRYVYRNGEKIKEIIHLPETTLYNSSDKKAEQAIKDLESAAKLHGVKVTRCVSVRLDSTDWAAIKGEPLN